MTWSTAARGFRDPKTGKNLTIRIIQPVCDDANYMANTLKWPLLGIIGNDQHWLDVPAGDHTARSTHTGRKGAPKRGWVYAIDVGVPDARKVWVRNQILKLARDGSLPQLKYFNISGRHYNQNNNFSSYVWSGDQHLHLSYERTYEESTGRGILRAIHGGQNVTLDKTDVDKIAHVDGVFDAPRVAEDGSAVSDKEHAANPYWTLNSYIKEILEEVRSHRSETKRGLVTVEAAVKAGIPVVLDERQLDTVAGKVSAELIAKLAELRFVPKGS